MIKVNWDVEELVALIDIYRRSAGKSTDQINAELWNCQMLWLPAPIDSALSTMRNSEILTE